MVVNPVDEIVVVGVLLVYSFLVICGSKSSRRDSGCRVLLLYSVLVTCGS